MKRLSFLLVVILLASLLTACGSKAEPTEAPIIQEPSVNRDPILQSVDSTQAEGDSESIKYDYEGALSSRLLLAFGTLKLADSSVPINIEQAPQMLMLWQALDNLSNSGTSAEEEVNALLSQIEQTFTHEQIKTINAMQLTQVELQEWAKENGITIGSGTGSELGTGQGMGQGSGLSPEARATKQAESGMTGKTPTSGESGLSAAITKALISYLESIK